ncbi:MAG: DMT family transporter [Cyclobacteriaceae bacterium]
MSKTPWWVHPALLTAGLLYGANYSIAKLAMGNYIEPYGLNLLRVSMAFLVFMLLSGTKGEKLDNSDIPRIVLCTLCGASLNLTMFFKGLSMTTPVNSALILTTSPIVVLIASYLILKEKIRVRQIIGVGLGLFGAFILLNTNELSLNSEGLIGDVITFGNTVLYSVYLVIVKPLMVKYHPFTILKWIFGLGLIIIAPLGFNQFIDIEIALADWPGLLTLGYVAVATTVFAYFLNISAIKHVSSTIVGYYIYLQPLFAGFIEIIFGRQEISLQLILSSVFIFLGVFLVSTKSNRP